MGFDTRTGTRALSTNMVETIVIDPAWYDRDVVEIKVNDATFTNVSAACEFVWSPTDVETTNAWTFACESDTAKFEIPELFTVDGIEYGRISANPREAALVDGAAASGEFVAPTVVTNEYNLDYTVIVIAEDAFSGNTNLTSVTLPENISVLGEGAFGDCSNLVSVTVMATNPPTVYADTFYTNAPGFTITVPAEALDDYKTSTQWKAYADYIVPDAPPPPGTEFVAGDFGYVITSTNPLEVAVSTNSAGYSGAVSVTNVVTFRGYEFAVGGVGEGAFSGSDVSSVLLPASVTNAVGESAFADCTNLAQVVLISPVPPALGTDAFKGTDTKIYVPFASVDDYKTAWAAVADMIQTPAVSNVAAVQRYPWNGMVDVTFEVGGLSPMEEFMFAVSATNGTEAVAMTAVTDLAGDALSGIAATNGVYHLVWDAETDVGANTNLDAVATYISITTKGGGEHGGVQLWDGGPYWATMNIGATNETDSGYFFWWGDTVGYTNNGSAWVCATGGTAAITFNSNPPANATCGKSMSELISGGVIDPATSNLVAAHDAATAHWGGTWRMPTKAEYEALLDKCTTVLTNGTLNGMLVTGKGDYSDRSIFIPAAGVGVNSQLKDVDANCYYWSASPDVSEIGNAWYLLFGRYRKTLWSYFRYDGLPVRAVADAIGHPEVVASGVTDAYTIDTQSSPRALATNFTEQVVIDTVWFSGATGATFTVNGQTLTNMNSSAAFDWIAADYDTTNSWELVCNPKWLPKAGGYTATFEIPADFSDLGVGYTVTSVNPREVSLTEGSGVTNAVYALPPEVTNAYGLVYAVTGVGPDAFAGNADLTAVRLPETVTNIGASAFADVTNLVNLVCLATNPPAMTPGAITNAAPGLLIRVPEESIADYKAAPGWSELADKIISLKLTVSGIDAQQRYPWNGLVDFSFTVTNVYENMSVAVSVDGGATLCTNLTVTGGAGAALTDEGAFSAVWDALADLSETRLDAAEFVVAICTNGVPAAFSETIRPLIDTRTGIRRAGETVPIAFNPAWDSATGGTVEIFVDDDPEPIVSTNAAGVVEWTPPEAEKGHVWTLTYKLDGKTIHTVEFHDTETTLTEVKTVPSADEEGAFDISFTVVTMEGKEETELERPLRVAVVAVVDGKEVLCPSVTFADGSDAVVSRTGAYDVKWDAAGDLGEAWQGVEPTKVDLFLFSAVKAARLTESGPYWAAANLGAEDGAEAGSYFWWGGATGYAATNDTGWISADGSETGFAFTDANADTAGKSVDWLATNGWIDEAGNLAPGHDAATAALGEGWRIPTADEAAALLEGCDVTAAEGGWIVTGEGGRSVFVPAAGRGESAALEGFGEFGGFWTAAACDDTSSSLAAAFGATAATVAAERRFGLPVRAVFDVADEESEPGCAFGYLFEGEIVRTTRKGVETPVIEVEEGGTAEIKVFGGAVDKVSAMTIYLVHGTTTSADLALPSGMRFPLTVTWAPNEFGWKTISIPTKPAGTSVEDDEFFTIQLGNPVNMDIADENDAECTVVIRTSSSKATLKDAVDNQSITMSTSGKGKWKAQGITGEEGEGFMLALSPALKAGEKSVLSASGVKAPGTLTFRVGIGGIGGEPLDEPVPTVLRFYDNNVEVMSWSGETAPAEIEYQVSMGSSHTFKWEVTQGSAPYARASVAHIVWTPSGVATHELKINTEPADYFTEVSGRGEYAAGTKVTIKANVRPNWVFGGWYDGEGRLVSTRLSEQVTVSRDIEYTAVFTRIPYLRALAVPPEGGRVSGGGLVKTGKATLRATPTSKWAFTHWTCEGEFNGSQNTTIKLEGIAGDLTEVRANFKRIDEIPLAEITGLPAEGEAVKAIVGVAFAHDLGVVSETLPKMSASGLPSGLKFDGTSIVGVPTKAGRFNATVTASNARGKTVKTLAFEVAALPQAVVGTFNGIAEADDSDGVWLDRRAAVTLTATAAGKLSAKIVSTNGATTVTAASWSEAAEGGFRAELTAKKGETLSVFVDTNALWTVDQMTGTLSGGTFAREGGEEGEGYAFSARRDPFGKSGKVYENPEAQAALAALKGYYTAAVTMPADEREWIFECGSATNLPHGHGFIAVTVKDGGVATVAGSLADGTKVSQTATVAVDEDGSGVLRLFIPLYSSKGFFAADIRLVPGAAVGVEAEATDWFYPGKTPSGAAPAVADAFRLRGAVAGCLYDKTLSELARYYTGGALAVSAVPVDFVYMKDTYAVMAENVHTPTNEALSVDSAGNIKIPAGKSPVYDKASNSYVYSAANASCARITLTKATGLFTGSFNTYYEYDDEKGQRRLKTVSTSYSGALTPWSSDAISPTVGWGFYTLPETWMDKTSVTYTLKRSASVEITAAAD